LNRTKITKELLPTNGCNHPETKTHRIKQLPANNHHLNRSTKTAAGAKQHHQNRRLSNE
jgi:hypothetical protein